MRSLATCLIYRCAVVFTLITLSTPARVEERVQNNTEVGTWTRIQKYIYTISDLQEQESECVNTRALTALL